MPPGIKQICSINDKFQFDPDNDKLDATFDVKETNNIISYNDSRCI